LSARPPPPQKVVLDWSRARRAGLWAGGSVIDPAWYCCVGASRPPTTGCVLYKHALAPPASCTWPWSRAHSMRRCRVICVSSGVCPAPRHPAPSMLPCVSLLFLPWCRAFYDCMRPSCCPPLTSCTFLHLLMLKYPTFLVSASVADDFVCAVCTCFVLQKFCVRQRPCCGILLTTHTISGFSPHSTPPLPPCARAQSAAAAPGCSCFARASARGCCPGRGRLPPHVPVHCAYHERRAAEREPTAHGAGTKPEDL
jgi:hypothetical protein